MSIYKNVIERLDEFTTRQGIVSGEWCKLLDMLESEREYLEANNAEFEKQNVILAHQLKYAETIITEVQADKFKLREKLELACEALEHLSIGNNLSLSNREALLKFIADREAVSDEAIEKIKGVSNDIYA